jgi:hypothetical protein
VKPVRREVLSLVIAILAVDAVFIGVYFVARVRDASDANKMAFTVLWTLVTLGVAIRGLSRVRRIRTDRGAISRT